MSSSLLHARSRGGRVTFEGTDAGAALFVAVPGVGVEAVVRVDPDGGATRIAEVECEEPGLSRTRDAGFARDREAVDAVPRRGDKA